MDEFQILVLEEKNFIMCFSDVLSGSSEIFWVRAVINTGIIKTSESDFIPYLLIKRRFANIKSIWLPELRSWFARLRSYLEWRREVCTWFYLWKYPLWQTEKSYSKKLSDRWGRRWCLWGIAKAVKVLLDALSLVCDLICRNNPEKGIKYRHMEYRKNRGTYVIWMTFDNWENIPDFWNHMIISIWWFTDFRIMSLLRHAPYRDHEHFYYKEKLSFTKKRMCISVLCRQERQIPFFTRRRLLSDKEVLKNCWLSGKQEMRR